jgi:hypothetical protein
LVQRPGPYGRTGVGHAQAFADPAQVGLYGAVGDAEGAPDLLLAQAVGQQFQALALALGQGVDLVADRWAYFDHRSPYGSRSPGNRQGLASRDS